MLEPGGRGFRRFRLSDPSPAKAFVHMTEKHMTENLSSQDVARLLSDPSSATRAEMAAKVATQFTGEALSSSERAIAQEIIRIMANDAVVRVRQSLAENLKHSAALPRDIAVTLARDVEAVALPILAVSTVLSDHDLMELVRAGNPAKQTVIAGRPAVSAEVADTLIDAAGEEAVAALVANEGADLGEASLGRVVDRFGTSEAVQEPLVHRSRLPLTIAERLVTLVSENLQEYLVTHHELPPDLANDLVLRSRERVTVGLVTREAEEGDVERLVIQLHRCGRLSPSLLVRSLCTGDIGFFEAAMARLARVPLPNIRLLIHDAGHLGLKSVYERAGLPSTLLPAVRIAIEVIDETDFDGGDHDRERHRRRVIERILTQYEDLAAEDLDYLLSKLSDLMPPPA